MSAAAVPVAAPKKSHRKLGVGLLAVALWGTVLLIMAISKEAGGIDGVMTNVTVIKYGRMGADMVPDSFWEFLSGIPNVRALLLWSALALYLVAFSILFLLGVAYWNWKNEIPRAEMTAVEIEEADKAAARAVTLKADQARLRQVKRVAGKLRKELIAHMSSAGFTYVYERRGIHMKASKPEIRHILFTKDSIYFRLDKLPFKVNFTDLMDVDVATNMSIEVGRECEIISDTRYGLFIRVDLRSGYHAIPKLFPWWDRSSEFNALDKLPASNPYTFALGVGKNRHVHHVDFRDLPHLLVAGATGGGKSVFLNQLILTLLVNNPPSRLQVIMIDMKDGLELYPYRNIPHLIRDIIYEQDKVIEALEFAMKIKKDRADMFRENGVRKIQDWNKTHHRKLPYILIVIDEIAAIMMNKKLRGIMVETMRVMAEQVRALGINIIICTQRPDKEALPGAIKTNIPKRIAFAMDNHGSRVVIGTEHASKLTSESGRMYYKDGVQLRELQAPLITPDEIDETIAKIVAGETANPRQAATESATAALPLPEGDVVQADPIMTAFRLALENRGGRFSARDVYGDMKSQLTKKEVAAIAKDYEFDFEDGGPVIDVDGDRYVLAPPLNNRAARRLMVVGDVLPTSLADIYGG